MGLDSHWGATSFKSHWIQKFATHLAKHRAKVVQLVVFARNLDKGVVPTEVPRRVSVAARLSPEARAELPAAARSPGSASLSLPCQLPTIACRLIS